MDFAADYYGGYYPYGYSYYPYSYGYTYPYSYYNCKCIDSNFAFFVSLVRNQVCLTFLSFTWLIADDPYAYSYGPTVVSFY